MENQQDGREVVAELNQLRERMSAAESTLVHKFPEMGEVLTEIGSLQLRVMELEATFDKFERLYDSIARLERIILSEHDNRSATTAKSTRRRSA